MAASAEVEKRVRPYAELLGTLFADSLRVTHPRRIEPGMTFLVTRRTQRRTQLLRPDDTMNELYLYLLAVIANRHGVLVHGVMLMSTHEHLIVTDVQGRLPRFLAEFHRLVALCVKVLRAWDGEVWDGGKTSVVELRTPQAVAEKLAYIAANPVVAGLVRHASEWPGITTLPEDIGNKTWTVRRPQVYLDEENPLWPETATLALTAPVLLREARRAVDVELRQLEFEAHKQAASKGWSTVAPLQLQRVSPFKRARSWEPSRSRNPTFAVGRGQPGAFAAAVAAVHGFRTAYREALAAWRSGARNVPFPPQTWLMRSFHGVAVCAGVTNVRST